MGNVTPLPKLEGDIHIDSTSLLSALKQRRSCRSFDPYDNKISLKELGTVLFAADGVTKRHIEKDDGLGHGTLPRHTAPSGGAIYPINVYVFNEKKCVEGLNAGLFQYDSDEHSLITRFVESDTAKATPATAASTTETAKGHQAWVDNASILLIFTGNEAKVAAKGDLYPSIADSLVELEVGMIAQNALLAVSCLPSLAATPIGAFDPGKLTHILRLPTPEKPILMLAVGRPTSLHA